VTRARRGRPTPAAATPRRGSKASAPLSPTYRKIYAVVRRIPRGRVATYGDVARLAGMAGQPRLVGYALHALPDGSRLPWHRVINAQGKVSTGRGVAGGDLPQRFRLEREGIVFSQAGKIALDRYRWKRPPRAPKRRVARRP
jgi:methylated-DNA-protein-cysteine methyltransferase-like protein